MSDQTATVTAAVITSLAGLLGAVVTVFKDEIKARWRYRPPPGVEVKETTDLVPVAPGDVPAIAHPQSRKRPFNSRIQVLASTHGRERVFILPLKRPWFQLLFMAGWLLAWTVGIGVAALIFFGILFGKAETEGVGRIPVLIFMSGWLLAALAGEFAAAKSLKSRLFKGKVELRFSGGEFIVMGRGGLAHTMVHYCIDKIDGFEPMGSAPPASNVGQLSGQRYPAGVFFRYGIDRIAFEGLTPNDAEWLSQELQRTLEAMAAPLVVPRSVN